MTLSFLNKHHTYRRAVDLGKMLPIRFVQYQQWHDVFISGPTRNVVGSFGNDFPGLYYYDPTTGTQHVIMFEGIIDWRVSRIERKIVHIGRGQKNPRLVVGLFSEQPIDKSVRLHHWKDKRVLLGNLKTRHRDSMPSQWEALDTLSRMSFRLLKLPSPQQAPDWSLIARRCLKTLNQRKQHLGSKKGHLWVFFETFASSVSTYELKPETAYAGTSELIAQSGLAASLLAYSKVGIDDAREYRALGNALRGTLHKFYDKKTGFFQNTYPPKGEEWSRGVVDTWYTFHNLYRVLYACQLSTANKRLVTLACKAVERAIAFVRSCNYQIPLFAQLRPIVGKSKVLDGSVIGYALNPSVLGMYAMILCHTATMIPNKRDVYHKEAMLALNTLRRWPISQLFHQTIQLSWAAAACHKLGLREWRDDFTRCLLLTCYRQGNISGLFQGCSGLGYPAFRETVDAVVPWVEWIDDTSGDLPLRHIIELILHRAASFIAKGSHSGLPQEGLATLEQPGAGRIGIAIYAAPQVFDLARLQIILKARRKE